MSSRSVAGPTQTASNELHTATWQSRKWAARIAQFAIFIFPLAVSILASLWASRTFPPERVGLNPWVWWFGLAIAATLLVRVIERALAKFAPLTMLFRLSLIFPDQAPSRFSVALKTGSTRSVKRRLAEIQASGELFSDQDTFSAQMLELVAVLATHDRMTRGHAERVRAYSELIGEEMGLSEEDLGKLRWSALLHDMGKLHVPSEILNKDGRPTEEEWAILKEHPTKSEEYLEPLAEWLGEWRHAAVGHHERWDGTGYPAGQRGTEIPLAARIVAVADAFDVMTSTRSYKKPMPAELARQEVADKAGSQFDPAVSRAFMSIGLGDLRRTAGPLAFLANLPVIRGVPVGNALTTAASSAASAASAAVAVTVGVVAGTPVEPAPEQLAFSQPNPPTIVAEEISGIEDEPIPGSFAVSGASPFSVTIIAEPLLGSVSLPELATGNAEPEATFVYTPEADRFGSDSFTVRICDDNQRCIDDTIVVSIAPINDAPEARPDAVSTFEDEPVQIPVELLLSNDSDIDSAVLSIPAISTPTEGTVSVSNGIVLFAPPPGFVGDASFTYVVSDGDAESEPARVIITVNERPNAPPTILVGTIQPDENSDLGTPIGSISGADPEGGVLQYSLTGAAAQVLSINETTGDLTVIGPIDFETTPTLAATFTVTDDADQKASETVTIAISDVNEAPVISPPAPLSVGEGAAVATLVTDGTIAATDPEGGSITYSLIDLSNTFTIDPATGEISLAAPLDYETTDNYSVTVIATEAIGGLETSAPVLIGILDVNEAPTLSPVSVAPVPENAVSGEPVVTVQGADVDGDSLSFAIIGGTGQTIFAVDSSTGEVTVAQPLDFETDPSYTLEMKVTDDGEPNLFATGVLAIPIADTNEAPRIAAGQSVSLAENSPAGTATTGPPIVATDPENDVLTFSLVDPDGHVTIDPTTGEIASTANPLNYETSPELTVAVTVTDATGGQAVADVTVVVTNQNDPPVLASLDPLTVDENQTGAPLLGQGIAFDEDGDALTYALTGPGSSSFSIDALGRIRNTTPLDFETNSVYTLTLTVSDSAVPAASASMPVKIGVIDLNEAPVVAAGQAFSIAEDASPPTTVLPGAAASDEDGDPLTFALADPSNTFVIDSTTGEIELAAALDFETTTNYLVVITASDGDGESDSAPATIAIVDVNEAPTITSPPMVPARVLENSTAGTLVTSLSATDPEGDQLRFSLTDPSGIFAIDPATGELSVANNLLLDRETQAQHTVVVTVDDALSGGTGSDVYSLDIDVVDTNERPEIAPTVILVFEDTAPNTVVATLGGTDPDGDTLNWAVIGGTGQGIFSVDSLTGVVTLDASIDYDTSPRTTEYTLVVTLDDGLLTDTSSVSIPIENVDEPPVVAPDQTFVIDENAVIGDTTTGGPVVVTDPENDPVTWSIADPTNTFAITTAGEIYRSGPAPIDFETTPTYTLQVSATGSPAGLVSSELVTINVRNVNDPVELTLTGPGNVDENMPVGTAVNGVSASHFDPDGDPVVYAIAGGSGRNLFRINATTGAITTAATFDAETASSYTLNVSATEQGTAETYSALKSVTVNINNVNEAPVIEAGQNFSILDSAPAGSTLTGNGGMVETSDVEGDAIASYAIVSGDPLGNFTIDANGVLSLATAISVDDGATRTLRIRATDTGTPAATSATQSVTVTVESQFGESPSPFKNQVVFNEISFSGHEPGSTQSDFVELFNVAGGTINLEGWTISDHPIGQPDTNAFVISFGATDLIDISDRVVVWLDPSTTQTAPLAYVEIIPASGVSSNASLQANDDLFLYDDDGLLVAYMAWGDASLPGSEIGLRPPLDQWNLWDPSSESSLSFSGSASLSLVADGVGSSLSQCWERTTSGDALAAGNCGTALQSADTDPDPARTHSAGETNNPVQPASLALANPVISEYAVAGMVDNGVGRANFIELYNASPFTYDLRDISLEIYQDGDLEQRLPIAIGVSPAPWEPGKHYLLGQLLGPFGVPGINTDAIFITQINSWDYTFRIVHADYGVLDTVGSASSELHEGTGVDRTLVTDRPQSFKRRSVQALGECQDTFDNARDFTKHAYGINPIRIIDGAATCAEPTYPADPSRQLVINELTTGQDVDQNEFIELFNPSSPGVPLNLAGYQIFHDGTVIATLPNVVLQPGDTYLLGGKDYSGPATDFDFSNNISADGIVELRAPDGTLLESIDLRAQLASGTRGRSTSWERANSGCMFTTNPSNDFEWTSLPTPRVSNPATATPC